MTILIKGYNNSKKISNKLLNIEQIFLKYLSSIVMFRTMYPFSQKKSVSFIIINYCTIKFDTL